MGIAFEAIEAPVVVIPEVVDGAARIDVLALLLDLVRRRRAVLEAARAEAQLRTARFLEEDRAQRHLLHRAPDREDAVVAQERRFAAPEALREILPQLRRVDEIARRQVVPRRHGEPAAFVGERRELLARARE